MAAAADFASQLSLLITATAIVLGSRSGTGKRERSSPRVWSFRMPRQACRGVRAPETNDAACSSCHVAVDEEALLVMKPHSATPLNTSCAARQPRDCDKSPPPKAPPRSAITFAATHHLLKSLMEHHQRHAPAQRWARAIRCQRMFADRFGVCRSAT